MTLQRENACLLEVFVTPFCSTAIADKVLVVAKRPGRAGTVGVPLAVRAETEVTTRLHYRDVTGEQKIGEGSFGVVFKGTFHGNDVVIKTMKDVGMRADAMGEFMKESDTLDKFQCDEIVHFRWFVRMLQ